MSHIPGTTGPNSGLRSIGGNGRPRGKDGIPTGAQALASALLRTYVVYPRKTCSIEGDYVKQLDYGGIAVEGIIAYRKKVEPSVNRADVEPVAVGTSTTDGLTTQPETPKNKWHGLKLQMAELTERLQRDIEPAK